MKSKTTLLLSSGFAISLFAVNVHAQVSAEQASQLGNSLTPVGAEKAANAEGSIPAWNGGLPTNAGSVDAKGFLANPFASEAPLFTITAQNAEQYKGKLSVGQLALFKRYPETYKIPVYTTHRTANLPESVLADTKINATTATLVQGGNGVENYKTANPFPIPQNGLECWR